MAVRFPHRIVPYRLLSINLQSWHSEMAIARLGLVSGNHALLGLCIAFISATVGMCPAAPLRCNLSPLLPALACYHRLCWNLPLVIILASRGQDGLLLKVACASCGRGLCSIFLPRGYASSLGHLRRLQGFRGVRAIILRGFNPGDPIWVLGFSNGDICIIDLPWLSI